MCACFVHSCVCVCACVRFVCLYVRTCVRVCVRACVRVCVRMCVCLCINIVVILVVETFKTTKIHKHVRINIHYKQYCLNMSIIQWSFFQCRWKAQYSYLFCFISFRFFHIIHFVSMIKVFTNLVLDEKEYIPNRAVCMGFTSLMSSSFNK